jgi:hypothetical protein
MVTVYDGAELNIVASSAEDGRADYFFNQPRNWRYPVRSEQDRRNWPTIRPSRSAIFRNAHYTFMNATTWAHARHFLRDALVVLPFLLPSGGVRGKSMLPGGLA